MLEAKFRLATKRRSRDLLLVPKELITLYQKKVGGLAVALWLTLFSSEMQELDKEQLLQELACTPEQLEKALENLLRYELISSKLSPEGPVLEVKEPLPFQEFEKLEARLAQQSPEALQVLFDFYQKQIGLMGPVQEEKLRYWVLEQGMDIEVIVAAIAEMVKTPSRRIEYLEGILRNWYNEGIRNLDDLAAHRKRWQEEKSKRSKKKSEDSKKSQGFMKRLPGQVQTAATSDGYEGVANASAYKPVDPEAVKRWKEMFKDDYSS